MEDVGWAGLSVIPTFEKFGPELKRGSTKAMRTAGEAAGEEFGDAAAETGGDSFTSKIGGKLKAGALLAGGAAGAALGVGILGALDKGRLEDKMAASLGLTKRRQEVLGDTAGRLFADAYGDSLEDINSAVAAVVSSIRGMRKASGKEVEELTAMALDYAAAFDIDVTEAVQVAGVAMESGLAKKGTRAFDLLTIASQKVPARLREDLLDAVEEYGTFFDTLGFTGKEAFTLLVEGSRQGIYGIDKAGDAVKEFTIRSTDMSEASKDAYKAIGLDAREMADAVLAGGDDAQEAFQKIIDGLLDIESPSKRANAAIALFGTPIEDLNVRKIPDFLRGLQGTSDRLDDVRGSAKRMGDTLNDNAATNIEGFKRKVQTKLVNFLGNEVVPLIDDKVLPAIDDFSEWFRKDGIPMARDFADELKPAVELTKDLVGFINDLPKEAKIAGLAAVLGGVGALKLRRGGPGVLGSAGSALGLAKGTPVYVTNWPVGFGGPGGAPGGGKTPPVVAAPPGSGKVPWFARAGGTWWTKFLRGAPMLGAATGMRTLDEMPDKPFFSWVKGADDAARSMGRLTTAQEKTFRELEIGTGQAEKFAEEVFGLGENVKDVKGRHEVKLVAPGFESLLAKTTTYSEILNDLDGRVVRIHFQTIQDKNVVLPGQTGPKRGSPGDDGGGRNGGVDVHIHGDVRPNDSREFMTYIANRSLRRSLDGRRP